MKKMMQWMLAAIRPLVLTRKLVLTAFFCGAIGITSCSSDDTDDEQPPQKVTRWECILFGSYPANEVVSGSFNAVDSYALVEGDVLIDAALYSQLEQGL